MKGHLVTMINSYLLNTGEQLSSEVGPIIIIPISQMKIKGLKNLPMITLPVSNEAGVKPKRSDTYNLYVMLPPQPE